ncbi:MAG: decarboxylase [Rhodospirillaceae bacterium]|nr:decarboxylase [Rhodospirillaceae bacterium]
MPNAQGTKPLGWRARLGVIIPTVNTVTEPEFAAMAPDGVTSHFTRMPIHFHPEHDDFKELMDDLEIRLGELKTCGSTIVAYNCTVGSMACPADMLKAKLESVTGAPAVATASSVLQALETLGVTRISMATPYSEETNAHEKEYLAAHGVEVVAMAGYDFSKKETSGGPKGTDYASVAPDEILVHARAVDRDEAEAVFISCANFGSAGIAQALEDELGKPVITSNASTFWAGLRAGGIDDKIEGFGRLLSEH